MYLLLRSGDITSEVFICASSTATRWAPPAGMTIKSFSNFSGPANLSYGYTNAYPSQAARKLGFKLNYTLSSDFAIAADMAPGPVVALVASDASRKRMSAANSPNHAGEGQNVLYADGHVDWNDTIFCGAPRPVAGARVGVTLRDNIFCFGADTNLSSPSAGTDGAPQDAADSVVLPTAGNTSVVLPPERSPAWFVAAILAVVVAVAAAVAVLIVVVKKKSPPGAPPLPGPL
jgi:prepilin-type processing-associated H-X9-DG protein